ncbi:hypothetical protein RQP46_002440 [Phenoliferia psychrophenolica]
MGKRANKTVKGRAEKVDKSVTDSLKATKQAQARREERKILDRITEQSNADRVRELERAIDAAEVKVQKLYSDLRTTQKATDDHKVELANERTKLSTVSFAPTIISAGESSRISSMQSKLDSTTALLTAAKTHVVELKSERAKLESENARTTRETVLKREGLAEEKAGLKAAKEELEQLVERRKKVGEKSGEEEWRVKRKSPEELEVLERTIEQVAGAEEMIEQLEGEIREINDNAQAAAEELVRRSDNVASAKLELSHLQSIKNTLVVQNRTQEVELATARAVLAEATRPALVEKITWTLRDERILRDARRELSENQQRAKGLEGRVEELEERVRQRALVREERALKLITIVRKLNKATIKLRAENANLLLELAGVNSSDQRIGNPQHPFMHPSSIAAVLPPSLIMRSILLLLPALAAALPQQHPFTTLSSSLLPPLNRSAFAGHELLPLNDGTFFPSPAFGVGSIWKHTNVTDLVIGALEVGYRHIDNAAFYATEEDVARAIRHVGLRRDEVYLTSKYDGLEGRDLETEFMDSLRKLDTPYLDQYLIHNPYLAPDPSLIWPVLESLVKRGLVRTIGVSNYNSTFLSTLLSMPDLKIPPAVNQIRYHAYLTIEQSPAVHLAKRHKVLTAAYSALTPLTTATGGPMDEVLEGIAEGEGMTTAQVLLEWTREQKLAVVTTSGNSGRQKEQLEVFGPDFPSLSSKDRHTIWKAGIKGELHKE